MACTTVHWCRRAALYIIFIATLQSSSEKKYTIFLHGELSIFFHARYILEVCTGRFFPALPGPARPVGSFYRPGPSGLDVESHIRKVVYYTNVKNQYICIVDTIKSHKQTNYSVILRQQLFLFGPAARGPGCGPPCHTEKQWYQRIVVLQLPN